MQPEAGRPTNFSKLFAISFLALMLVFAGLASASPVWKGTLTSTDAGQSNRLSLSPNQTYELMCYGATGCWAVAADAGVLTDCAKDQPYPTVNRTGAATPTTARELPVRFATPTGLAYIAARAWDAGNPDCQVYQMVGGGTAGSLPLGPVTPR